MQLNGVSGIVGRTFETDPVAYFRRARALINNKIGLGSTVIAYCDQATFEHMLSYIDHMGGPAYMLAVVSRLPTGVVITLDDTMLLWSPYATPGAMRFYAVNKKDGELDEAGTIIHCLGVSEPINA